MILSRKIISAMSPDEHEAAWGEIRRWLRAGAKDGTEAPPLVRPAGHVWTRAEIAGLDEEAFAANEEQLYAAAAAGQVKDVDGR